MDRKREASRCRQRIMDCAGELQHLTRAVLGHSPLVRGSLYAYRRRCGKPGCRCARGRLHHGQALGVSQGGRSRAVPLAGLDRDKLAEHAAVYRELRRARATMVRTFAQLLREADRLERLREVPVERLRQGSAAEVR